MHRQAGNVLVEGEQVNAGAAEQIVPQSIFLHKYFKHHKVAEGNVASSVKEHNGNKNASCRRLIWIDAPKVAWIE